MTECVESSGKAITRDHSSSALATIIHIPMQEPVESAKDVSQNHATTAFSSVPETPSPGGDDFSSQFVSVCNHQIDHEPSSPAPLGAITLDTTMDNPQSPPSPTRRNVFQRMVSQISNLSFVSAPQTARKIGYRFFSNDSAIDMTRRATAETQLKAILNDPEDSLPACVLQANMTTLDKVRKQLSNQSFIIDRLLDVVRSFSNSADSSPHNQSDLMKLTRLLNSTTDVRALLFFMMVDEDGDQYVTSDEMRHFLQRCLQNMSLDTDRLQEAIEIVIKRLPLQAETGMDFEEFHAVVMRDATILRSFSQFTLNPADIESAPPPPPRNFIQRCCAHLCLHQTFYNDHSGKLTPAYLTDNLPSVVLFTLYILVNLALVLYVIIYRAAITKSNALVVFARIGGMLLSLNCTLIIVLMLRRTIRFIRSITLLRKWIPVDEHIDIHKHIGRFIAALAILHTGAHMINFALMRDHSWATFMFTTTPGIGWIGGFASISGLILCAILAIMVVCSVDWIRRKAHFKIFYWTHLLYPVFYLFLILHSKHFWKFIIVPLTWFFAEKLYSLTRYSRHKGWTSIHSATIQQSGVISLNILRPKNFTFKPGDYINISLPDIASYEFHPFTISSAPEEEGVLRVHIKSSGNWTKRVYEHYKNLSERIDGQGDLIRVFRADESSERAAIEERDYWNATENVRNRRNEAAERADKNVVIVNGPYSSCARYIFDCKHAVLIGGGIGVTPYASILSSLMAQFRASRTVCQHCQGINYNRRTLIGNRRLRKVDFIWVSRDHKSFEWFLNLLRQFEREQATYLASDPTEQPFLTIHLYFTEIKADGNIGNCPLALVGQVWAEVTGGDIFTGLTAGTHIGRPNWNKIFANLHSTDDPSTDNDVNVFFCGLPAMGKSVKESCAKHKFRYYEEKF